MQDMNNSPILAAGAMPANSLEPPSVSPAMLPTTCVP